MATQTKEKCDRMLFDSGKKQYVRCFGNLINRFVDVGESSSEEHKVCEKCGKDFGEVQFSLPIDLTSCHNQLPLEF
ncbi:MAG: hypothetical protein QG589_189 [Patescibacteria group bacterium]|nr:hypothetical protein [Patescibacteria group bacterium]